MPSGAIESGEGDDQTIGSTRIAKALREARKMISESRCAACKLTGWKCFGK